MGGTEDLRLATAFSVHYLKIFSAKDVYTARNRRRKESCGAESISRLEIFVRTFKEAMKAS